MKRWWNRLTRRQKGNAAIEFLILVPMLVFLAFIPANTWIVQVKRGYLESIKDRYLQRAQVTGGFTAADWAQMLEDLERGGFDLDRVRFDGSTPVGEVRRREEEIKLNIGYPIGDSTNILSLVGITPPDPDTLIWVTGTIMSEKP